MSDYIDGFGGYIDEGGNISKNFNSRPDKTLGGDPWDENFD